MDNPFDIPAPVQLAPKQTAAVLMQDDNDSSNPFLVRPPVATTTVAPNPFAVQPVRAAAFTPSLATDASIKPSPHQQSTMQATPAANTSTTKFIRTPVPSKPARIRSHMPVHPPQTVQSQRPHSFNIPSTTLDESYESVIQQVRQTQPVPVMNLQLDDPAQIVDDSYESIVQQAQQTKPAPDLDESYEAIAQLVRRADPKALTPSTPTIEDSYESIAQIIKSNSSSVLNDKPVDFTETSRPFSELLETSSSSLSTPLVELQQEDEHLQTGRTFGKPITTAPLPPPTEIKSSTGRGDEVAQKARSMLVSLLSVDRDMVLQEARLATDLTALAKKIQNICEINNHDPRSLTPARAVQSLLNHESVDLNIFRSMDQKVELLKSACLLLEGSVITQVVLYLQRTLRAPQFFSLLRSYPKALAQYRAYLSRTNRLEELEAIFSALHMEKDATLCHYEQALQRRHNPALVILKLDACLSAADTQNPTIVWERAQIADHCELLKRSTVIEEQDAELVGQMNSTKPAVASQAMTNPLAARFAALPRASITYSSVAELTRYCLTYHNDRPPERRGAPTNLRKSFEISEKHFAYLAVQAYAVTRNFGALEALFTVPASLFRTAYLKSPIGWDFVVKELGKSRAPPRVLEKFVRLLPDPKLRLQACEAFRGLEYVAVETLVELKDRSNALAYRDRARARGDHASALALDAALHNAAYKWS